MIDYYVDLHVHTVLSPCGDIIMTPQNIIDTALAREIDILAITDHNSIGNLEVALELAKDYDLTIIPGMEVESKEGVHLVSLFPNLKEAKSFQKLIYDNLPFINNDEDLFGPQLLTDQDDKFISRVKRLLLVSANLSVHQIVKEVLNRNGIIFPAHIDKKEYSILTNLGFIPAGIEFPIIEIYNKDSLDKLYNDFPLLKSYQVIKSSDAHFLHDLKPSLKLTLAEPSLSEMILAFKNEGGRKVMILE
ncbi:PHP domain-containing protein [Selenihalanaerobacter shriftii]|uniref:Polymerase/histidinol phosphatase N-terminal domain-containing protein n=1 Tax=Selenihalanaerobacter shriftii TaxID=142842 RepID=A0A1T4MKK0_9FIRM|nr:PHP domain-containing protein [Selenihalanaerobacter shriftii]SJZ67366.1 hypothetical protein SAMN02745118_01498 [Selenihalanaerobacter shriftii]